MSEIKGDWTPDEVGTFNSDGWGFQVIAPDDWSVIPQDEWPQEVQAKADALERSIRDHLNGALNGARSPDSELLEALKGLCRAVATADVATVLLGEAPAAWANVGGALAAAERAIAKCEPQP